MAPTSKVDAIQARLMGHVKREVAAYRKRNTHTITEGEDKGKKLVNEPTDAFIRKCVSAELNTKELIEAFVDDVLAGAGA